MLLNARGILSIEKQTNPDFAGRNPLMRLERLHIHQFIRVLRVVLPLVVITLVAIPSWNYWSSRQQPKKTFTPKDLPKDIAVRTDNFTFSRTQGGRTLFTIQSKTNVGFLDNRNMLEDVVITIHGDNDSDPVRYVRSRNCSYDQKTEYIVCTGSVEIQLDATTTAQTEEVTYSHNDRLIVSTVPVRFERPGSINGSANALEYSMKSGLLKLTGAVKIHHTTRNVDLESAVVVFHEKDKWVHASGGVLLKSPTGWVRGMQARAELEAGSYKPTKVIVDGEVSSEASSDRSHENWKLDTGWLQVVLSSSGVVENLAARNNVTLRQQTADGGRVLSGVEMDAAFDKDGKVDLVETRTGAKMTLGADRFLTSDRIFATRSGMIETPDASELRVGEHTVKGRAFKIQTGDVVSFQTASPATLTSGARQTSADTTDARFDSRTNQLIALTQTGHFRFEEADRKAQANKAVFENNAALMTLEGSARFSDPKAQVEADRIQVNDETKKRSFTGNVRTVVRDAGEQMLVTSSAAEGTDEQFTYRGKVKLYRGDASIVADELEMTGTGKNSHPRAKGNVFSTLNNLRVWADALDYDEPGRTAIYTGRVTGQKQDMKMQSAKMTVTAQGSQNAVSRIITEGNVIVKRGASTARGDQATYEAASQQILLTGSKAEFSSPEGVTAAPRITLNVAGNRMAIAESGQQQAVTKYKIPKKD
jgi:lipopolysaccharide transport protein LptA